MSPNSWEIAYGITVLCSIMFAVLYLRGMISRLKCPTFLQKFDAYNMCSVGDEINVSLFFSAPQSASVMILNWLSRLITSFIFAQMSVNTVCLKRRLNLSSCLREWLSGISSKQEQTKSKSWQMRLDN